jgi:hypothetical protein
MDEQPMKLTKKYAEGVRYNKREEGEREAPAEVDGRVLRWRREVLGTVEGGSTVKQAGGEEVKR